MQPRAVPCHTNSRATATPLPCPGRYAVPLQPVSLRERHADGGYVAAEDAENGADVISFEEDMALR